MSWKATAWAKGTRGHHGLASKLLLLILADYYDDEKGYAWPSQQRLADDCEMSIRTIQHALAWLEEEGFISTLQKGNQYQETQYAFNFAFAGSQSYEPAKSEPAKTAGAKVNPQTTTSEPAMPIAEEQSPPLVPPSPTPLSPSYSPPEPIREPPDNNKSTWPEYFSLLWGVAGFKTPLAQVETWRLSHHVSEELALLKAYALRDWWPRQPPARTKRGNPYFTWQHWCRDEMSKLSKGDSDAKFRPDTSVYEKAAAEQQQRREQRQLSSQMSNL